jgi:transcriptional regulator with XRE-family HTH domain
MTSFQIGLSPSRRAAGRFVSRVRRALQRAVVEEGERNGLNQSKIADAIGVHRSVISRELNGRQDITLGRIAELAWAMGREIEFDLVKVVPEVGSNATPVVSAVILSSDFVTFEQDVNRSLTQTTTVWDRPLELTA